ncbi:MAG TPA: amidohydrolase family protein [Thermoanaerobaculia bacterium]
MITALVVSVGMSAAPKKLPKLRSPVRPGGTIGFVAPVRSMDGNNTAYSSIQITKGTISSLGQPVANPTLLPPGAVIYPGFIDSHSHAISLLTALATDPAGKPYWTSLANVNVMQLPPCPQTPPAPCFAPVATQAQVISTLQSATPNSAGWVLGWNYEASRLTCPTGYGFVGCPNFENQSQQTALQQMDAIRSDVPMMVTSESGHIVYVNSRALSTLNICPPGTGPTTNCYMPIINTAVEKALAQTGQLDEDVALYAIQTVENLLGTSYAGGSKVKLLEFFSKQIVAALNLYSQLGYTTVQEGAASKALIEIYMATAAAMAQEKSPRYLPATVAFLEYDGTTPTKAAFGKSVNDAKGLQKKLAGFDMFIAGMKVYADGSTQGYTGDMTAPVQYQNQFPPFTNAKIFRQPYDGLPDYNAADIALAATLAHKGNLPLWVHTNGNQAQINVLGALEKTQSKTLRDVLVHFAMPTEAQVIKAATYPNLGATFLVNDFYYFYQPLCEQVLGSAATQNLYPIQWVQENGIHYGLHSDASVTPPSPLFGMWVATTRRTQTVPGIPPLSADCTAGTKNQLITPLQAMAAYTNQPAWLYNRDMTSGTRPGIGSLQSGFAGDLVVLSADPLAPDADLSKIYVLYTVHNGNIVYPASGTGWATSGPVWPD